MINSPVGNRDQPGGQDYLFRLAAALPRLFSYHLAWSGDVAKAQWLTEETVFLAGYWQAAYHAGQTSPEAWFFGLARYVRVSASHEWLPHRRSQAPDNPKPLPDLAFLAQLSGRLGRPSSGTSDALVLAFFAGLSPTDIGHVLGIQETSVNHSIAAGLKRLQPATATGSACMVQDGGGANLAATLEGLAQSIQPNPDWLRAVQNQALTDRPHPVPKLFLWQAGAAFRRYFRLRSIAASSIRLLPILLVCGMALAWWLSSRPASPLPPAPPVEPALAANFYTPSEASGTSSASSTLATGYLVPPDPAVCQNWQALFAKNSPVQVTLGAPVSYLDPTLKTQVPEGKGTACQVEVLGSRLDFPNPGVNLQAYLALLKKGGFQAKSQCDTPQNNCVFGVWYTLQNGSLQAILSFDWRQLDSSDCPIASNCMPFPKQEQYIFRLLIATDSTRTVLETFFNAWMQGDASALDSLTPELRKGVSTIDALDALAGIRRTPADSLQLTWNVVENTGSRLRLSVQEKVNGGQAYLFQVILTRSGSQWKVSTIAAGIIFPPSTDVVYWAGHDGAIYRYSLADKTLQAVTSAGIYSPQREDQPEGVDPTPPEISPDGRWLALYQSDATLLVDLQNAGMAIRLPPTGSLAWSRDGGRIAFVEKVGSPEDIITMSEPFTGAPTVLARLADEVAALAWSPDGSQLAALTIRANSTSPAPSATQAAGGAGASPPVELRDVSVIDAGSGKVNLLATLRCPVTLLPNPFDLAWTADGQEIWYRSFMLAIRTRDGATQPLVFNRGSTVSEAVQDSVLFPQVHASGLLSLPNLDIPVEAKYLVSPDGRWVTANPFSAPNWYVNHVSLAPVDNEQQAIWSVYLGRNIYSLAWTQDSQALIAGGGREYQAGAIFRLNAATGESQALADGVFWIGVGSGLQDRSLAQAPEASAQPIPADLQADWPCQSLLGVACIRLPPGWNSVVLPVEGSFYPVHWVITNLAFPAPIGWASPKAGTVSIEICPIQGVSGSSPEDILQSLPPTQQGSLWEPVSVDGVSGVHLLTGFSPGLSSVIFPTRDVLLEMDFNIDLEGGFDNPVIQKILQSIRFE